MVNKNKNIGYFEVGILDNLNKEVEFKGYKTLAAGYNWSIARGKYYELYIGFGAIAAFEERCEKNENDIEKRQFCSNDANQGSIYGDSDLLLYPEARLSFKITKKLELQLATKKMFSVNKSFTPDSFLIGLNAVVKL